MTTSSQDKHSSSDQEPNPEVTFHPSRQPQPVPSMFMPNIEGPKMDWTVNDGFYHRFLKWHLKCENILECELAALPECKQCKKEIAWSGDFGMDQYVSISDGSVDLDKFPANRVRQLAKKLECSKATVHHIKQVAEDPQAVQITLLRYQYTELPVGKYKKK